MIELPSPVAVILQAARAMALRATVTRSCWGVGIGTKRRWQLTGSCCCVLSALLVVREAVAERGERSPIHAVARELGIREEEVRQFIVGYDDDLAVGDGSEWFGYGRQVAQELGLAVDPFS